MIPAFFIGARGRRGAAIAEAIAIPAGALAVSLLLFGAFVAVAGADPREVYHQMYRGSFGTWFSFQNTLVRAAPLILTALCVAIPARLGLIVIGGEGALVLGGLAAAVSGATVAGADPLTAKLVMAMAALIAGGLWIGLCTALRALRGVNETISSLLLTYLAVALFHHVVEGPLRDPASLNKPSTVPLDDGYLLGNLPGAAVHWGLGFGLGACALAYLLVERTHLGFQARVIGGNVRAAHLAGVRVRTLMIGAGVLGGACAGLAGMTEVAAVHGAANASLIAGYGYGGIVIAFLARHHPLAIPPVAVLVGGIAASGGLLQRTAGLPDAAVNVLQGILFVVILGSEALRGRLGAPRAADPTAAEADDAAPVATEEAA